MNGKQSKRLRKTVEATDLSAENNYEAIRTNNQFGLPTIVLAECQKALYKELKKGFKRNA